MPSPAAEAALQDALSVGKAILKFISRNDVGDTRSHQCGYYLPKHAWHLFTQMPPTKGQLTKTNVQVLWSDGRQTDSVVTWYGQGTRSEYRLTRFGKDFPFLDRDNVGSLLVIVPVTYTQFRAYVVDTDEDIEFLQAGLGIEIIETLAAYERGSIPDQETESECIERHFREVAAAINSFPSSRIISNHALSALDNCLRGFRAADADKRLMAAINAEYRLFRMIERKLCGPMVTQAFRDIDDFLEAAQTILQRRKGRAGLAFQNHVQALFADRQVSFTAQPVLDDNNKPDFILPNVAAYKNPRFPREKVTILALKTTCKDRWRQVLEEAPDVPKKHIFTMQPGISVNQLRQMKAANVTLVVPKELQKDYNVDDSGIELLTVQTFIDRLKEQQAARA